MSAPTEAAIRWGPTIRLTRAMHCMDLWRELVLLALFFLIVTLGHYEGIAASGGRGFSSSSMFLVMECFFLYSMVGAANAGWTYLPVTARERKAAAWLIVGIAPLLFHVSCWVVAVLFAVATGQGSVDRALLVLGVHGLAQQIGALLIFLLADWPATASQTWEVDQRTGRDWLLGAVVAAYAIGSTATAGLIPALAGFGPLLALALAALCVVQLPIALKVARLSPRAQRLPKAASGARSARSGGRMPGGWRGHFLREAMRAMWLSAAALLGVGIFSVQIAMQSAGAPPGRAGHSPANALLELPWLVPLILSLFVMMVSQSLLLRQRRMLLSLPNGATLVLATPAFTIWLVLTASLGVAWFAVPPGPGWAGHILAGVTLALALGYLQFAMMLGANSRAAIMLSTMLVIFPIAVLTGIAAAATPFRALVLANEIGIAAGAAVLLALSLLWCRHQLRHSRKPYRPWPIMPTRWRGT